MPAHSLLFSKSTKGVATLNVPIRRTNRYQQYYMPSQHTYCGRVWNLIQACDVQYVPDGASGKALGYGLDGPGSIHGVGGVEIFLHSVSRLVLGSTQPPIK